MTILYIKIIDEHSPNPIGLQPESGVCKFKFRGGDARAQKDSASLLAGYMQDPDVSLEAGVEQTLDLDGYTPPEAVRLLFDVNDEFWSDSGTMIYRCSTSLTTEIEEVGEAFIDFLALFP